ncbi:hypothetical protein GOODEAATRI_008211 [Goodea atripinnis]|uniref:dUTPase-like domain-containing protein n=1 Tax=Goodea atripinnis TaxID=208336 RepID=A0ABV0MQA1_9TELE
MEVAVLRSGSTGYLVSCAQPCVQREDVRYIPARSKGVIPVHLFGNLVLHSIPAMLKVSLIARKPRVQALIDTPLTLDMGGDREFARVRGCYGRFASYAACPAVFGVQISEKDLCLGPDVLQGPLFDSSGHKV